MNGGGSSQHQVYCTKNPSSFVKKYKLGKSRLQLYFSDEEREKPMLVYYHELEGVPVNVTVVGEFTVNEISEHTWSEAGYTPAINEHDVGLNREEIVAYGRGKTLYVWRILPRPGSYELYHAAQSG